MEQNTERREQNRRNVPLSGKISQRQRKNEADLSCFNYFQMITLKRKGQSKAGRGDHVAAVQAYKIRFKKHGASNHKRNYYRTGHTDHIHSTQHTPVSCRHGSFAQMGAGSPEHRKLYRPSWELNLLLGVVRVNSMKTYRGSNPVNAVDRPGYTERCRTESPV